MLVDKSSDISAMLLKKDVTPRITSMLLIKETGTSWPRPPWKYISGHLVNTFQQYVRLARSHVLVVSSAWSHPSWVCSEARGNGFAQYDLTFQHGRWQEWHYGHCLGLWPNSKQLRVDKNEHLSHDIRLLFTSPLLWGHISAVHWYQWSLVYTITDNNIVISIQLVLYLINLTIPVTQHVCPIFINSLTNPKQ